MSEKIRAFVFESFGEKLGDSGLGFSRCPGMECPSFRVAAGKTWLEKAEEACFGCGKCNGNFPINPDEVTEAELIDEIIADIEEIYSRFEVDGKFDLDSAGYVKSSLVLEYGRAVKEVERLHSMRMQGFIKAWLKPK